MGMESTGAPVKEIKKKNSPEVLGEKQTNWSLVVIQQCGDCKGFDGAKVESELQSEGGDLRALIEDIRQELTNEKYLNANLRLQLKKTQESNFEFILALSDMDEMLEQMKSSIYQSEMIVQGGNVDRNELLNTIALLNHLKEISDHSNKLGSSENAEKIRETHLKCETDDDEEQEAHEELVRGHSHAKEAYLPEKKIKDLNGDIKCYRKYKDDQKMQMEQLVRANEKLKEENHDILYKLEQSQPQEQRLKMQYERSSLSAAIPELEAHIESLEDDLKEFFGSLSTIRELQTRIKSLEEELLAQRDNVDRNELLNTIGLLKEEAEKSQEELRRMRHLKDEKEAAVGLLQSEMEMLKVQIKQKETALETSTNSFLEKESELEEMRERYLEMSLKFAEVEGDRQQLARTVRKLKNAIRSPF